MYLLYVLLFLLLLLNFPSKPISKCYFLQVELTKLQFLPATGAEVSKEELLVASEYFTVDPRVL